MGIARGVRAAVAVATTAVLAVGAFPAHAAAQEQFDAGQWWMDAMGVHEAHEQVTGAGVTIALLDTPIYLEAPELQGQDVEAVGTRCRQPWLDEDDPPSLPSGPIADVTSHATSMAALLVGNGQGTRMDDRGVAGIAPGAALRVYSVYDTIRDESGTLCRYGHRDDAEFLREVLDDGADIVLVTADFVGGSNLDLQKVVNDGVDDGVVFVLSAGNDGPEGTSNGLNTFDGVVNVVAGDADGVAAEFNSLDRHPVDYLTAQETLTTDPQEAVLLSPTSDGAGRATILAPGVDLTVGGHWEGRWESDVMNFGTSGAAGLAAGALALAMERWPEASGNQILQSMVRNANHPNDIGFATNYGYGGISLASMLSEDATQYPDVHPYYGGLRWAFEDDPPVPIMTGRGGTEPEDMFWQPTYAEDEQDLFWPLGPQRWSAEPSATATVSASAPAQAETHADGTAPDAAAPEAPAAKQPWGWLAVGATALALLVAGALWARARAVKPDHVENMAPEKGPRA